MSDTYKSDRAISRRAMLSSFIGAAFLARFPALRQSAPCADIDQAVNVCFGLMGASGAKSAMIGIGGKMFIGDVFTTDDITEDDKAYSFYRDGPVHVGSILVKVAPDFP